MGDRIGVEKQMEEHTDHIGLKKEDAIDRTKWCMLFSNFQEI